MTMTTEELVARRVHITEQIARLTDEKQQIDDRLRGQLKFGKNPTGEWTTTLSHNRTFDAKRFAERHPVALYPQYYTAKPDITEIKQFIPPAELDQYYAEGAPIVKVA